MTKNKKQKRRKAEKLRLKKIDQSVLPDKKDYPESKRNMNTDKCLMACPKCLAIHINSQSITIETKQGPVKMRQCDHCQTIYRLVAY